MLTTPDAARLPRRDALALLAVVVLSWAVAPSGGMYTHVGALLAFVGWGLAVAACLLPEGSWRVGPHFRDKLLTRSLALLLVLAAFESVRKSDPVAGGLAAAAALLLVLALRGVVKLPDTPLLACLAAAALLLSGNGLLKAEVLYGASKDEQTPLLAAAGALGALACVGWLFNRVVASPRGSRALLLLVFGAGFLLRAGGILGSPDPVVDVLVCLRDAPDHLLEGRNPYTADYHDVYDTDRARALGVGAPLAHAVYPAYLPTPLLVALPFRAAGLDPRWANVVCDLLAALALYAAAARRGPLFSALLTSLYLLMPRAPFLIEQAWYEPMIAAALGGGLLLAGRGRRAGFLLLGLGLTAKQFGLPMLFPLAWAHRRSRLAFVLGLVAAGAVALPFLLWDPLPFLDVVLFAHLKRPPTPDSITLPNAALQMLGVALPRLPLLVGAAALIVGITAKTRATAAGAALGAGAALLTFCLVHTQGYFNYFYLCQYLLLLGLSGGALGERRPAGSG